MDVVAGGSPFNGSLQVQVQARAGPMPNAQCRVAPGSPRDLAQKVEK